MASVVRSSAGLKNNVLCSSTTTSRPFSSASHSADGCAPAIARESVGDAGAEGIGCVAPEILGVVFAGDSFFVVEAVDGFGVLAVGNAHEHVRQGEANVARVLGEAEAFPPRVHGSGLVAAR